MKVINITVDDKLFNELNSLMSHHGQRMFLLRSMIKKLVKELKEVENEQNSTSVGTKT